MLKIRISYDTQQELEKVLRQLKPLGASVKYAPDQKGQHKRAYLIIR